MRDEVPAWPPVATESRLDGAETLRRAVDAGGEPGRPRPDDDEIARRLRAGAGSLQPDRARELGVVRVAQHGGPPDHHGRLLRGDAELSKERLGLRVQLEVDPPVGHAVARRKSRRRRVSGENREPTMRSPAPTSSR